MTTFEIAQALGQFKGQHDITCTEKGYFYQNGERISKDAALETLKILSSDKPSVGCRDFDKLNAATQAFFFTLCEQILEVTRDASASLGVTIGKDIPQIGLVNAPRLTNLKKAGVFHRGGKGWLQLTEFGRAIFLATV